MTPPPARSSRQLFALRALVVLGIGVLVYVAYATGVLALFTDPAEMKRTLLALGTRGYLVYLAAFTLLQPIGCPGMVFVVGASLVWPPPVAIALSLTGSTLASIVGFSVARFLARDWVEKRLPARFRAYDEKLAEHAFRTIFLLRVVFLMHPLLHGLFGISRAPFGKHLVASVLGYVPAIVIVTYAGGSAVAFFSELSSGQIAIIVSVIVVIGLAYAWVRWRARRRSSVAREPLL